MASVQNSCRVLQRKLEQSHELIRSCCEPTRADITIPGRYNMVPYTGKFSWHYIFTNFTILLSHEIPPTGRGHMSFSVHLRKFILQKFVFVLRKFPGIRYILIISPWFLTKFSAALKNWFS